MVFRTYVRLMGWEGESLIFPRMSLEEMPPEATENPSAAPVAAGSGTILGLLERVFSFGHLETCKKK